MAAKKAPNRMGSVWTQLPFMHGEDGAVRLIELTGILADAKRKTTHRRELLARHPHLAAQAATAVRCKTGWNGYVPPASNPDGESPPVNESPARVQVEALLRQAARADAEEYGREVSA